MRLVIVCILTFFPLVSFAVTIHVPADQPTIQAGIDVAVDGDTVLIAAGTYTGPGNYDIELRGKQLVVKGAGAASTIIDVQLAFPHSAFMAIAGEDTTTVLEDLTIKKANIDIGGGLWLDHSSLTLRRCVIDSCAAKLGGGMCVSGGCIVMDSCTVTRCSEVVGVNWVIHSYGGGIFLDSASARITNCYFEGNRMYIMNDVRGGAIFVSPHSSLTVDNSTFYHNWVAEKWPSGFQFGSAIAGDSGAQMTLTHCTFLKNGKSEGIGGAVYSGGGKLVISDCQFISNGAFDAFPVSTRPSFETATGEGAYPRYPSSGGALYCLLTDATVSRCLFASNIAEGRTKEKGGAVVLDRSTGTFAGCTFVANTGRSGFAIFVDSSTFILDSSIVAFDTASTMGGSAIEADTIRPNVIAIHCSDIYGNDNGDWVGCIDSLKDKYNNFSKDPRFCKKSQSNYYLQENSMCRAMLSPCGSLVGALPVQVGCTSCCIDQTGNINTSGIVDLADLSLLISYLTTQPPPALPCVDEANVNNVGIVDLADLSMLIAYLTQPSGTITLPWCP